VSDGSVYEFYNVGSTLNAVRLSQSELLDKKLLKDIIYSVSSAELKDGTIIVAVSTKREIIAYKFKDEKFVDFKTLKLKEWAGKANSTINSLSFAESTDYSTEEIQNIEGIKAQISINKTQDGGTTSGGQSIEPDYAFSKSMYLYFAYGTGVYRVKPEMLGGGCIEEITSSDKMKSKKDSCVEIKKLVAKGDKVLILTRPIVTPIEKWNNVDLTPVEKDNYKKVDSESGSTDRMFLINRFILGTAYDSWFSVFDISAKTKTDSPEGIISDVSLDGDKVAAVGISSANVGCTANATFLECLDEARYFANEVQSFESPRKAFVYVYADPAKPPIKIFSLTKNSYGISSAWNKIDFDDETIVVAGIAGYIRKITKDGLTSDNGIIKNLSIKCVLHYPNYFAYDNKTGIAIIAVSSYGILEVKLPGNQGAIINRPTNAPQTISASGKYSVSAQYVIGTPIDECALQTKIDKITNLTSASSIKTIDGLGSVAWFSEYNDNAVAVIQTPPLTNSTVLKIQFIDLSNPLSKYKNMDFSIIAYGSIKDVYLFDKHLFILTTKRILRLDYDGTKNGPNTFSNFTELTAGFSGDRILEVTEFDEDNQLIILRATDGTIRYMSTADVIVKDAGLTGVTNAIIRDDNLYVFGIATQGNGDIIEPIGVKVSKYLKTYDKDANTLTLDFLSEVTIDTEYANKFLFQMDKNDNIYLIYYTAPLDAFYDMLSIITSDLSGHTEISLDGKQTRSFMIRGDYIYYSTPLNGYEIYPY